MVAQYGPVNKVERRRTTSARLRCARNSARAKPSQLVMIGRTVPIRCSDAIDSFLSGNNISWYFGNVVSDYREAKGIVA